MAGIYYFIMVPMVYISIAVMVVGIGAKIASILAAPPPPYSLKTYPARERPGLAALADTFGMGMIRRRIWVFVVLPHLTPAGAAACTAAVHELGLFTDAHATAGCVVACTGNRGCKYASADTKGHARALMAHLRERGPVLDTPVNLHLTGCPHSCAQHYCGDLGGVAVKLPDGREGYHVVLGGGLDQEQGIAREIFRNVAAADLPALAERVLTVFAARRAPGESFAAWTRRHEVA